MLDGDDLADVPAGRVAHIVDPLQAERIEQRQQIVGQLVDGLDGRMARPPRAAMVVDEDLPVAREIANLLGPVRSGAAHAGCEDEGLSLAVDLVVLLDPVRFEAGHRSISVTLSSGRHSAPGRS